MMSALKELADASASRDRAGVRNHSRSDSFFDTVTVKLKLVARGLKLVVENKTY